MNMDISQIRSGDVQSLLSEAASISGQMCLADVDVPAFFIALQQACPDEVKTFLERTGVAPDRLFSEVAEVISRQAADETPDDQIMGMSPNLINMLKLTVQIEAKIPQVGLQHGGLLLAIFLIPGPMRDLGESLGLTSAVLQSAVMTPLHSVAPASVQPSAPTPVQSAPQVPQRTQNLRPVESTELQNCPTISQFSVNMLEQARSGLIRMAVGRDDEIIRVLQILARGTKNNPVLVGESGTGKTATVHGVAHKLLGGQLPQSLASMKLFSLNVSAISAAGNPQDILLALFDEVKREQHVVLFVDNIHMLLECNCGPNKAVADMLKQEMAAGAIRVISTTSVEEYNKTIEKDGDLKRACEAIKIEEPDVETSIEIVKGAKAHIEAHHGVTIPDDVVESAVRLTDRFVTDRRLPGKAILLLDDAAACATIAGVTGAITVQNVKDTVTDWTGIPMPTEDVDEAERLNKIEEVLHNSVIGQDEAISAVANAIRRNKLGFGNHNRPIGSFLFLGTTGVGKTELCKALAEYLFQSRDMIVRIDMSEYQQEHSASRLFGAPPGYVGYEQGGQLTESVRSKPYSIVLFDEVEKAHPKIFETLLQVLDDGRMTDGKGRVINFKNTIIVMTSNMGQDVIRQNLVGRTPEPEVVQSTTEAVMAQMRMRMAPEFVNRISNVVMFLPLTMVEVRKIAEMMLKSKLKGQNVAYTPAVVEYIAVKGYDPANGARPIDRAIDTYLINPLINAMGARTVDRGRKILCDMVNGEMVFRNEDQLR